MRALSSDLVAGPPTSSPIDSSVAGRSLQRPQRWPTLICLARHISRLIAYDWLGQRYVYFVAKLRLHPCISACRDGSLSTGGPRHQLDGPSQRDQNARPGVERRMNQRISDLRELSTFDTALRDLAKRRDAKRQAVNAAEAVLTEAEAGLTSKRDETRTLQKEADALNLDAQSFEELIA